MKGVGCFMLGVGASFKKRTCVLPVTATEIYDVKKTTGANYEMADITDICRLVRSPSGSCIVKG
jgi:hypothetical protein